MKKWYWRFDTARDGEPRKWWAYGKMGERVRWPDGVTNDWLSEHGFKTRAAAVRSAGGNGLIRMNEWRNRIVIDGRELPETGLHYKIYKCYEIVILDKDGNEVGDCNYCYGTKADAEETARHELKIAELSR